jgi:CRP-like cAMP-binding protein
MISAEILRRYPYFAGIKDETFEAVASISDEKAVQAGETLFKEGEPASYLYIVTQGEVDIRYELHGNEEVTVDTVVAGDLRVWSAVVEPQKCTANAVARTDVGLVTIEAGALRAFCEKDPALGYRLMTRISKALSNRLDGARVQLAGMSRLPTLRAATLELRMAK